MITPLYMKTDNSLLSSMIQVKQVIEKAKELNLASLAITDTTLYGIMDFYETCKINHIKPIIGLEITIEEKPIILYVVSKEGYHHLIKLSTLISENLITLEDLHNYSSGLLCIIPFCSREMEPSLKTIYSNVYQGYSTEEERSQLQGNNLVFCKEILCLEKKQENILPYLYAIKGKQVSTQEGEYKGTSLESNLENIKIYQQDIKNNEKITELCSFEMPYYKDLLPVFPCPDAMDSFTYLRKLCKEGLKRIFGQTVSKVYIDRLQYELEVINTMGFCNYFLVVQDYVAYAKSVGILVGPGRGSAAGSLVSYCLGITTIDPIQYNLLFERFLNPERISMPDIDIDFEYNRRGEVIDYCIKKYGIKKVAPIITFGTLGAKQVLRDVGRTMAIPNEQIDKLCKIIDSRLTLLENYQSNEKMRKMLEMNANLKKNYQVSLSLEGLKRHTSIHAAGIVMCKEDLDTIIPLDKHGDFYTTGYSMEYLEKIGLLKMDFLALQNLTTINEILKDVKTLTFDTIPLQDEKALSIFTSVNTIGIFQFESNGMMNFLRKLKATTFEDVFAALALFRPGPMGNIDSYIKRKNGKESIDYLDESLEIILKPTYGIIVYQEQIMQIANKMAGYSLAEADILRKAMSKKKEDVLLKEKDKFIAGSIQNGYPEETASKVYDLILKFASYGFNRAHSVAYAMVSYKMAYLKAHYPTIFIKNLLSMVIGSEIKTKEYILEAKMNGIQILKPDITVSDFDYKIEGSNIRYPLTNIKNLGISAVTAILEERGKSPFSDVFDFVSRCYGKSVNSKTLQSLIKAGCLDSFGFNKKTLENNLDLLINYGEVVKDLGEEYTLKPELTITPEYSKKEQMKQEQEVFGLYLSNHPVTEYRMKDNDAISLENIATYFDKVVKIIVYVEKMKEVTSKNNSKMCFITGSDEISNVDIVLFPRSYELYSDVEVGDIIEIYGRVEKRFDKYQIMVKSIKKLKEEN